MATRSMQSKAALWAMLALGAAHASPAQDAPQADGTQADGTVASAGDSTLGGSFLVPLPIREVTIFKDGHAFVLQSGRLTSDARGQVVLGGLPSPVLGTFWPFAVDARLQSATASQGTEVSLKNAQSVAELLKSNVGAQIIVLEDNGKRYEAKILGVPAPEKSAPGLAEAQPAPEAQIILLQTEEGVRAAPLSSIQNVIFKTAPSLQTSSEARSTVLRLQLDSPNKAAQVGAVYLQSGLRWIPNYRLQLGDGGRATMKLQATLVNELANLKGVSAHLAIGVPSFAFRDMVDPIALQSALSRVSPAFQAQFGPGGFNGLSNSIQSQQASSSYALGPRGPAGPDGAGGGPSVGEGKANEDFFFFDVNNLSLKKGERSVLALAQNELKFQDVYVAQSPAAPPPQVYQSLNSEQQRQATLAARAQFMHKIRLTNTGQQPLTTAPTLIERNGQLLAQTLMTYTATGGRSDIDLAPAVDITLKRSEDETKRTPDALTYNDNKFSRIDVAGKLTVTSFRAEPVTVEITRQFVGTVSEAGAGPARGAIRQVGAGDDAFASPEGGAPAWWSYTNDYWRQVNPLSSVTWSITLPAKGAVELPYKYSYFWR